MTNQIELSAGTLDYEDTGGDGPAIVLLSGLVMDASLWEDVIAELSPEHRCIAPTLPMGAHRHAMSPDADLSPCGQARLVWQGPLVSYVNLSIARIVAGVRCHRLGKRLVWLNESTRPLQVERARFGRRARALPNSLVTYAERRCSAHSSAARPMALSLPSACTGAGPRLSRRPIG